MGSLLAAAKVAVIIMAGPAAADAGTPGIDAGAAVRALNADLLAHDSASEVLGRWCASHRLADPPVIRALRDKAADKPAGEEIRMRLRLGVGEPVRFRQVRLVCGSHVLSNADNWYVPDRLTPEMNRRLDETDAPFGLVVKPLGFRRVRRRVTVLLGHDGRSRTGDGVLRHEALLVTGSGLPFSYVVETYTAAVAMISSSDR
jgi:hypothetical protein